MISKKRNFKALRLLICLAVVIAASSMFLTIEPMASENSKELVPAPEQEASLEVTPLRAHLQHSPVALEQGDFAMAAAVQAVEAEDIETSLAELPEQEVSEESAEAPADEAIPSEEESTEASVSEEDSASEESSEPSEESKEDSSYYEEPVQTEEPSPAPSAPAESSAPSASYSDLDYLAAICQIEAGYSYDGCLAVANVVLNRLNHSDYPDNIHDVIYESYQFATGWMSYYLENGTSSTARQAAADALAGSNNIGGYLHFNGTTWLNPDTLGCPYIVIDGNCFY